MTSKHEALGSTPNTNKPGMVALVVIPALGRRRQNQKFKSSYLHSKFEANIQETVNKPHV